FRDLLQSRGGRIHAVDEPHAYNGGLTGHIGDDHVLVGTAREGFINSIHRKSLNGMTSKAYCKKIAN
ncbi:MAG: hypothetical protein II332_03965, partial [Kiritimatiellae bacterium]|nr:hypothetical protein [Kiritimatiellia bacterium]